MVDDKIVYGRRDGDALRGVEIHVSQFVPDGVFVLQGPPKPDFPWDRDIVILDTREKAEEGE